MMSSETKITFANVKLGSHVPYRGSITDTIRWAIDRGFYTAQFFLGSPLSYNRARVADDDIEDAKQLIDRYPTKLFTHAPYLFNLAGSIKNKAIAWNGNTAQDNKTGIMLKQLNYELNVMSSFSGVVIHPGACHDREKGLSAISESINHLRFGDGTMLLLENCAGERNKLASDLDEIRTIIDGVAEKDHIGVCIDTQHIFGRGLYDFGKVTEIDRFFDDFDRVIGINYLKLIHLNDSMVEFGSRVDKHACIGYGLIWGNDMSSLIHLLNRCETMNIPVCVETSPTDAMNLSEMMNNFVS